MKWIIGIVAALLLAIGGYAGYTAVYDDGYSCSDETVYEDDSYNYGGF